jgi:hypothetical protein
MTKQMLYSDSMYFQVRTARARAIKAAVWWLAGLLAARLTAGLAACLRYGPKVFRHEARAANQRAVHVRQR